MIYFGCIGFDEELSNSVLLARLVTLPMELSFVNDRVVDINAPVLYKWLIIKKKVSWKEKNSLLIGIPCI
jgi:hypothetical protein